MKNHSTSMELTDEERALIEQLRASEEAERTRWSPIPSDAITADLALAAICKIHKLALEHFNGVVDGRTCGPDCDCKQYIYEAAMETLALPGDEKQMWDEFARRRQ